MRDRKATARADSGGLAAIKRMLDLNQGGASEADGDLGYSTPHSETAPAPPIVNADGEPIWKVLVFDNFGRDVISSVLRVDDLREKGVTNHLYVDSELPVVLQDLTK